MFIIETWIVLPFSSNTIHTYTGWLAGTCICQQCSNLTQDDMSFDCFLNMFTHTHTQSVHLFHSFRSFGWRWVSRCASVMVMARKSSSIKKEWNVLSVWTLLCLHSWNVIIIISLFFSTSFGTGIPYHHSALNIGCGKFIITRYYSNSNTKTGYFFSWLHFLSTKC